MEALYLKPDHILFVVDSDDLVLCDEQGNPEVRLCNMELISSAIGDEVAFPPETEKPVLE